MAGSPTGRAQSYPVLGQIIADIQIVQGVCAMPIERLKHWSRFLWVKYPRHQHPRLYQMLGGMCLEFAQHRSLAAVQLYALATLGATAEDAEHLAEQSEFLRGQDAARTSRGLHAPETRTTLAGMAAPSIQGASIRRRTTGSM